MRDKIIKELKIPLCSTIAHKRKKETLLVPLDFEIGLTLIALVDLGANVRPMTDDEVLASKQQAPTNNFSFGDLPSFQTQIANGQQEKLTATPETQFGADYKSAEHLVVMKN